MSYWIIGTRTALLGSVAGAARDFGIVAFGLALAPAPPVLLVDDEDGLR